MLEGSFGSSGFSIWQPVICEFRDIVAPPFATTWYLRTAQQGLETFGIQFAVLAVMKFL